MYIVDMLMHTDCNYASFSINNQYITDCTCEGEAFPLDNGCILLPLTVLVCCHNVEKLIDGWTACQSLTERGALTYSKFSGPQAVWNMKDNTC